MQEAHAVNRIADGTGELPLERSRIVGRVRTGLERDDLHVEALRDRELHPAQRRVLAGGVGVKAEEEPLREPGGSRSWASVSAVPIDATTGAKPACRNASTSVFPSTTTPRSSRAIACRAVSSP